MGIWVVLAPVMVTAVGACAALAAEPFIRDERKHRILPWLMVPALIIAGLLAVSSVDDVPSRLYGLFSIDPAKAWLVATIAGAAVAAVAGLQQLLSRSEFAGGEPYALVGFAACGAMGMVLATDLLSLLVSLELASLAIYGTIGMRRDRPVASEGLFKYLVMGAVFSAIFLYGMAMTYGATGSTTFGAEVMPGRESIASMGLIMVVLGLLFKVGAVPFHFWSPDAYTGASLPITGFMAAAMKIGGFTALASVWLHFLVPGQVLPLSQAWQVASSQPGIATLAFGFVLVAVLSLLVGNFSALGQHSVRRLLAFSSVAHAGYLLMALHLASQPGNERVLDLSALWLYLVVYALATLGVMTAISAWADADEADDLDRLAGAGRRHPLLGVSVAVLVASMAGIPATGGFIAKYQIFANLVDTGQVLLAIFGMIMAVVGAGYYIKLLVVLFSSDGERTAGLRINGLTYAVVTVAAVLVIITFFTGLPGMLSAAQIPAVAAAP